jgi:hypothetical protein
VDVPDKHTDDAIEPTAKLRLYAADIANRLGNLEICDGLSSGTKRVIVASPTSAAPRPRTFGDIQRHRRARPSQLPSVITIEASDLIGDRPNQANHLKTDGINT